MKKLLTYSILFIILMSCQKEIEFDYPEDEPRLTLFSVLRPQDTAGYYRQDSTYYEYIPSIDALINQTTSVFDINPAKQVSDAKVLLFEDNSFAGELLLDSNNNPNTWRDSYVIYDMQRAIYKGKTYRYEVTHPDFPPVSAEVTIPNKVPITSAVFDTTELSITFSFKDPPEKNYYRFSIGNSVDGDFFYTNDPDISIFRYFPFDSIILKTPQQLVESGTSGFISDLNFPGKTKTVKIYLKNFSTTASTMPDIDVYLENLSPDYYEFLRTQNAHMATKDNPFAEPVKIHGNVKNGVGIVGAATTSSKLAIKK